VRTGLALLPETAYCANTVNEQSFFNAQEGPTRASMTPEGTSFCVGDDPNSGAAPADVA